MRILSKEVFELSEDALEKIAGGLKFSLQDVVITSVPISAHGDEQTLSIGSQSSGAGAGKVTFNPF